MRSWPQTNANTFSGAMMSKTSHWTRALEQIPLVYAPLLATIVSATAGFLVVFSAVWPGLNFSLSCIDEGYHLAG
jgi:hypothetical protein